MASGGKAHNVRSDAGGDVVATVAKLNAKLASGGEAVLESLRQLQSVVMTFEALEATKVGRAVNALRKTAPSEQARQLAAVLYRSWKDLADDHFVATPKVVVDGNGTMCPSPPVEVKKKQQQPAANGSSAVAEAVPPAVDKKQRNIVRLVIKKSKPPSGGGSNSNQQWSAASPAMTVSHSHQGKGPAAVASKRVSPAKTSAASSLAAKAKPLPTTAPPKPRKRKEAPAAGGMDDEARLARAKKRLHEGYKEASTAKEKRKIQVIAAAAPGKRRQR